MTENHSEKTEIDTEKSPHIVEMNTLWKAVIGGIIGAVLGTWVYPDIGSIIGAIFGIVCGALLEKLLAEFDDDTAEEIVTLDISKKAHAFFGVKKKILEENLIVLPKTEKREQATALQEKQYQLRLFERAVTSRGTGVFPHQRNKKPKDHQ